jgi:hypothetical protein
VSGVQYAEQMSTADERIPTPSGAGAIGLHILDDRFEEPRSLCGVSNPQSVALRSAVDKLPAAAICPKCRSLLGSAGE